MFLRQNHRFDPLVWFGVGKKAWEPILDAILGIAGFDPATANAAGVQGARGADAQGQAAGVQGPNPLRLDMESRLKTGAASGVAVVGKSREGPGSSANVLWQSTISVRCAED